METTRRIFLSAMAAGVGMAAFPGIASAADSSILTKSVAAEMARSYFAARVGVLGAPSDSFRVQAKDLATQAAVAAESISLDKMSIQRESLASVGMGFSESSVTVDSAASQLTLQSSTEALLTGVFETKLIFAQSSAPTFTADKVTRRVKFVRASANTWRIDRVQEVVGLNSSWLDPVAITQSQIAAARNAYPADNLPKPPSNTIQSVGTATDYAYKWYNRRNPAYKAFDNDCQNFVSQVQQAGGWGQTNGWYHYYNGSAPYWSSSWSVVNKHYTYWVGSRYTANPYRTAPGDGMAIKPSGSTDLTHSMIVMAQANGERYLAGHSNDRWNWPFSGRVVPDNSGSAFYFYGNNIW